MALSHHHTLAFQPNRTDVLPVGDLKEFIAQCELRVTEFPSNCLNAHSAKLPIPRREKRVFGRLFLGLNLKTLPLIFQSDLSALVIALNDLLFLLFV